VYNKHPEWVTFRVRNTPVLGQELLFMKNRAYYPDSISVENPN